MVASKTAGREFAPERVLGEHDADVVNPRATRPLRPCNPDG